VDGSHKCGDEPLGTGAMDLVSYHSMLYNPTNCECL
jgi:hypothetical protein